MEINFVEQSDSFVLAYTAINHDIDIDTLSKHDRDMIASYTNKNRIAEFCTVRHLIRKLGFTSDIQYRNRKPYFVNHPQKHLSITHNADWVAVGISDSPIGIDIEVISSRILRIQNKFLSQAEQHYASKDEFRNVAYWSAKESMFKFDNNLHEFAEDMILGEINKSESFIDVIKPTNITKVNYHQIANSILTWVRP